MFRTSGILLACAVGVAEAFAPSCPVAGSVNSLSGCSQSMLPRHSASLSHHSLAQSTLPLRGAASPSVTMDLDWYKCEKGDALPGGGHKYKFTVDVDGKTTKEKYMGVMTEFKKTARFPGFRPGTIPPFMVTKVKQFVILECLEATLADAVGDQGLELADDETKPTLDDEQVDKLTKEFKEGKPFTYVIDAELKGGAEEAGETKSDGAVDVEAVET